MSNIILLIICFISGIFYRRTKLFPENSHTAINNLIIYVSLPATILYYIPSLPLKSELIFAAIMPWIIFFVGIAFFLAFSKLFSLSRNTTGALIIAGGFGNTSFVGIPMIEAYYGKELIGVGIVADQPGSFLALSTAGIITAIKFSSGSVDAASLLRRVILFPPFITLILAFFLIQVPFPEVLNKILLRLSDTLAPLALFSVGFQLRFRELKGRMIPLSAGIAYQLILSPLVIFILYRYGIGLTGDVFKISVFEAAMAPMITAGIIAMNHDLDPPLVSLLIGIGIPVSFITLPIWVKIIG